MRPPDPRLRASLVKWQFGNRTLASSEFNTIFFLFQFSFYPFVFLEGSGFPKVYNRGPQNGMYQPQGCARESLGTRDESAETCNYQIRSDQSLSRVQLFATPRITARQASLLITNSRSSLRLMSIESVMPSSHLILCRPLLLFPPIPPSIRVFSNESTLRMRWPEYWSFSFSIIPSKEIPGLISFRMDWLHLLKVQGTLKSLLQHHSSKASILQRSGFFTVQLSHPYMTTGKTIVLTRRTFVGKVMSLLFNMLSRLVITFLPRSKRLLISWLQSPYLLT